MASKVANMLARRVLTGQETDDGKVAIVLKLTMGQREDRSIVATVDTWDEAYRTIDAVRKTCIAISVMA